MFVVAEAHLRNWFSEVVSLRRTTSRNGFGEGTQAIERGTSNGVARGTNAGRKVAGKRPA
jgi:hypothetical protein